jgi:hypothetical protein
MLALQNYEAVKKFIEVIYMENGISSILLITFFHVVNCVFCFWCQCTRVRMLRINAVHAFGWGLIRHVHNDEAYLLQVVRAYEIYI